jgi:hypothetical protein
MAQHSADTIKHVADGLSIATVIGTLAQVLPAIAALFTIIWTGFRIYETKTVQSWLGKGAKDEEAND